jgi:hypothetical protein
VGRGKKRLLQKTIHGRLVSSELCTYYFTWGMLRSRLPPAAARRGGVVRQGGERRWQRGMDGGPLPIGFGLSAEARVQTFLVSLERAHG